MHLKCNTHKLAFSHAYKQAQENILFMTSAELMFYFYLDYQNNKSANGLPVFSKLSQW